VLLFTFEIYVQYSDTKKQNLDILTGFFCLSRVYLVSIKQKNRIRGGREPAVHSLIPLDDFKAVLSLDDREDALICFCLVAAAYTIEEYCMRRLVGRNVTDCLTWAGSCLSVIRTGAMITTSMPVVNGSWGYG
jgi:hypothetical protein